MATPTLTVEQHDIQRLPMSLADYLLSHLAQECAEVIVRATKAQHFGLLEVQPEQPLNNQERLLQEVVDLKAMIEVCERHGLLPEVPHQEYFERVQAKMEKAADFRVYSRQLRRLEP